MLFSILYIVFISAFIDIYALSGKTEKSNSPLIKLAFTPVIVFVNFLVPMFPVLKKIIEFIMSNNVGIIIDIIAMHIIGTICALYILPNN